VVVAAAAALADCRRVGFERFVGRLVVFGSPMHRSDNLEPAQGHNQYYDCPQPGFLKGPSTAWIL